MKIPPDFGIVIGETASSRLAAEALELAMPFFAKIRSPSGGVTALSEALAGFDRTIGFKQTRVAWARDVFENPSPSMQADLANPSVRVHVLVDDSLGKLDPDALLRLDELLSGKGPTLNVAELPPIGKNLRFEGPG